MKLLITVFALLFSGMVAAKPLHNIVVFGDSLSDNGNLYELMKHQLPQSPPYFEGHFSNGRIWIEYLTSHYFPDNPGSYLEDYAYGGAGVTEDDDEDDVVLNLRREVKSYLLAHQDKAKEDSLFMVWIGANNYLGLPDDVEGTVNEVNTGIVHSLQLLVEKGAKNILVLNLPDLGKTPAALEFDSTELMSLFSNLHNRILSNTVDQMKQTYPEVNWFYFDMNEAFNEVLDHADHYGFTNTTETCVQGTKKIPNGTSVLRMTRAMQAKELNMNCDGYLFFDLVHPTTHAHQILAGKTQTMIDSSGIELSE